MADVYSIQGFLWKYKKGVTGGSWKKNWVYADSTVIAQYGGNQRPLPTEAPKYKWKIADCSIRSSDLRRFAFEVTMHGGGSGVSETAIFAADDSKSFEKWMKILIDTHVERERQEQSQSEERYSYEEVEAIRGGEEKSSADVAPWQRVEQQAKEFFKRNKAKGTMTVADLIDLIHSIDERLVPHRVLTFLAIETKRTLGKPVSPSHIHTLSSDVTFSIYRLNNLLAGLHRILAVVSLPLPPVRGGVPCLLQQRQP